MGIRGLDSKGVFSLALTQLIFPSALTEGDIMLLIGCGPRYQGSTYQSLGTDACAPWGRIKETEARVRG